MAKIDHIQRYKGQLIIIRSKQTIFSYGNKDFDSLKDCKDFINSQFEKRSKCCNAKITFNNATGDYICKSCRARITNVL